MEQNFKRASGHLFAASRVAGVLVLAGAAMAGGSFAKDKNDSAAISSHEGSELTKDAAWPSVIWPLNRDAMIEARLDALMARMTVEEKVGQTVQGDIASITPDDIRTYRLGSILAGGNSDPGGRYNATPAEWLALADAFHDASVDPRGGGQAIPILFGIDAMHGNSNVVGATLFPHNIGLGATRNVALIRQIGEITAMETRVTGMDWSFAPTVTVPQDDRWGRTFEGYSESPALVAEFAPAMVEGLQGKVGTPTFLDASHVMASVKHFVGDGGTTNGKDQGETDVDDAQLARIHGAGYPPAIAVGAQSVMASYNSVNGEKMHGHRRLLTDVLKGRMNFGGFVVGDWNGHGQVKGCSNDRCPASLNAGLDMFMAPDSWKGVYTSTLAAVKSGEIPMSRLDDAVRRIMRVKLELGLFEAGRPSQRALGGKFSLLGAPEHRAVARQAVRESLVLLKNQGGLLPLDPRRTLLVAGDGANDMGKQSGGWTLSWQGTGTTRADFPNADTIFEGLQKQVQAAGGTVVLSVDGRHTGRNPDAAIVVFGENPYAEFQGDIPNLLHRQGDVHDLALIKRLKAEGIPVVAVFLSGRPLWVNREINAADAFVAAWLPGGEGAGIADVLLRDGKGAVAHDFKGKLSFSWPRTGVQYANNVGQDGYDPQFAFGAGLSYADNSDLAPLPEVSGAVAQQSSTDVYFVAGRASTGYALHLRDANGVVSEVTATPAALSDGSLRITAVDHLAQEDARRVQWSGAAAASVGLVAATPLDLSRESNGDMLLQLTLRVDAPPAGDVWLGAGCGADCGARVPVSEAISALPVGRWTRLGVPLKCFAGAGADMTALRQIGWLETAAKLTLTLASVTLASANAADHVIACPTLRPATTSTIGTTTRTTQTAGAQSRLQEGKREASGDTVSTSDSQRIG